MTAQSITVTLNSKPTFETVRMRAEDTARKLLVTVVDTNSQFIDLTNLTVEFRAKRPDGTEITYTEQVEIQDSVILIGPTPLQKAIAVPGIVLCELLLYGTAGYIGTATWQINAWLPAVRNAGQQSTSDFQSAVEAAVIAVAAAERAETAANDVVQYSSHPAEIRDGYWWTWNTTTGAMENSGQLAQGADGRILEIVPGDNIDVDDTDPARPIVASTGGGGTGDMLKSDYDPNDVVSAAGGIPNVAFDTYTHSSSGTVHFLSGGTGPNIKFIATADYVAGDTFEVNGTACTAQTSDGVALANNCFIDGMTVSCFRENNALVFNVPQKDSVFLFSGFLPVTAATGRAIIAGGYKRFGNLVFVSLEVTTTTAINSNVDIATGFPPATIAAPLSTRHPFGLACGSAVGLDGSIRFYYQNNAVSAGQNLQFSGWYYTDT